MAGPVLFRVQKDTQLSLFLLICNFKIFLKSKVNTGIFQLNDLDKSSLSYFTKLSGFIDYRNACVLAKLQPPLLLSTLPLTLEKCPGLVYRPLDFGMRVRSHFAGQLTSPLCLGNRYCPLSRHASKAITQPLGLTFLRPTKKQT